MATKIYNDHIYKLLLNSKKYYILDTYIVLAHVSQEIKNRFIIQTYTNHKSELINLVGKHVETSYRTIRSCIDDLISLDILDFDNVLNCWYIKGMENMYKKKDYSTKIVTESTSYSGYTYIREFFLSKEFSSMKAREKRLIVYMAHLADSKSGKMYSKNSDYNINLLKSNNMWKKVLQTNSKYYAKYQIQKVLSKYNYIFEDVSDNLRSNSGHSSKYLNFLFFFNCTVIKDTNENSAINLVKKTHLKEYNLVKDKIKFFNITLSKQKIMHLVRSISTLQQWHLKERVCNLVLNKYRAIQIYNSREDIKSLPAYAAAVVKSVIEEYNIYLEYLNKNKLKVTKYEHEEIYNTFINSSSLENEINIALNLI